VTSRYKYARLLASSRKNQNNEDRVHVRERDDDLVVVVADGAGGLAGGTTAADAVVEAVRVAVDDSEIDVYDTFSWNNILIAVDRKLAATFAGETTAIVLVVSSAGVFGASVGDSQAWIVSADGIDDLTEGQNKKRLGSGRAAPMTFFRPRLDGVLVVGTDGLFNYTTAEQIAQVVRGHEPREAVEQLRALVQLPSGNFSDDVGVVILVPRRLG
jgi:serine/threonine protein phosphatase PrpC